MGASCRSTGSRSSSTSRPSGSRDDSRRDVGLQLPRVEGDVLSREVPRVADARVLRPAARDGRDQLYLLPDAECEDRRRLGRGHAGRLYVRAQGTAAHHAHRPAQGHRRSAALLSRDGAQARLQARAHSVPAAAQLQEGSESAERSRHAIPGGPAVRLGVPSRVVVRGRRVRGTAGGERRVVRRGHRGGAYPARRHCRLRRHAAARRWVHTAGSRALGPIGEDAGERVAGRVRLLQARRVGHRAKAGAGVRDPACVVLAVSDVPSGLSAALAGRYRIERELGRGGMATVYLAHDLKHDRSVALKVLRPELAAVLGAERFLREIAVTARLDHPHILTLIDSGAAEGFLFYVVPYVRGESLREKLTREKQLPLEQALQITQQVAGALDYAHRQGVIHRDIKPENILLHEGEAVVADFGIALAVTQGAGDRLTESGLRVGTPAYMSPEQATGDGQPDARSDVYSLAAVLYEMLAGEPPHTGPTAQAIIAKLLTEPPMRLAVVRGGVSAVIDAALARALAKLPAERFASAADFAAALAGAPGRAALRHGRSRNRRALTASVAVATVLVAGWGWLHSRAAHRPLVALMADVDAQHPGLLARITVFGTPDHGGGPHWRDPVTAGELKLAVKRILRLE